MILSFDDIAKLGIDIFVFGIGLRLWFSFYDKRLRHPVIAIQFILFGKEYNLGLGGLING